MTWGPKEERLLITGVHTVADIYCTSCNTVLGWKYVGTSGFGHERGVCQDANDAKTAFRAEHRSIRMCRSML